MRLAATGVMQVTVWAVFIGAVLIVCALCIIALLSSLGLEPDQQKLKERCHTIGLLLLTVGLAFQDSFSTILGAGSLLISHPRLNLKAFSKHVDKQLMTNTHD